jgi:hypothetical protein
MTLCTKWNQELANLLITRLPIELLSLILGFMNDPTFIVQLQFASLILETDSNLTVEDLFGQQVVLFMEHKDHCEENLGFDIIQEVPEALVLHQKQCDWSDYFTKEQQANQYCFDKKSKTEEEAIGELAEFSSLVRDWSNQHQKIQDNNRLWNSLTINKERRPEYFQKRCPNMEQKLSKSET